MVDDRVVALAMLPTLLGGLVVMVASFVHVAEPVAAGGLALVVAGAVAVAVAAVRVGRRRGDGALRALGRGGRTLVGWLIAFLP